MSRLKKLTGDTLILTIGTFSSKLLVFFLIPLYTSILSAEQFGTAELITTTSNLLIPIAGIGVGNAVFRFAAEKSSDKAAVFSSGILLLSVGLGIFLFLSPLLSLIGFLDGYVWLIILYVLLANLHSVLAQYVRAMDRMRLFAMQGIVNTVVTILFNLLFLLGFSMNVTGYVLSVILGNLITAVWMAIAIRVDRIFRISSVRRSTVSSLLRFGLPLMPMTLCWLITDLSDRYMLTWFCGEAVTGIYAAAYKIPTVVTLLSGIFMQAWQFSAVTESADRNECSRFYSQVFAGFLSLVMIGGAGLIFFSREMTVLLLDESYFEAWRYMPTLIVAAVLEALVSFLATVYLVRKKSVHSFVTAMSGCLLNVLVNLWLIPMDSRIGGAQGAALATLAAYALVLLLRIFDVRRLLPFAMRPLRLGVSVVLLIAEAALMGTEIAYRPLWVGLVALLLVAINALPLLRTLSRLFALRREARAIKK